MARTKTQSQPQTITSAKAGPKTRDLSREERLRLRLGDKGYRASVFGVRAGLLVVVVLVDYFIAFFLAVRMVPTLMAAVQQGTGVTTDMPIEVVIAGWIVPCLFLVAVLFVAGLFAMRSVWRFARKLDDKYAGVSRIVVSVD